MSSNLPMVFSVTSGKGGVGKTNISVNLACHLSRMGKKVLVLDADLGLANVDVLLGIAPKYNLFHLFHEGTSIRDVLYKTEFGFDILPASSGVSDMVSLSTGQKLDLLEAMDHLEEEIDYLIVDTGAGINENVLYFNLAVQERLLVLTPEPTSLTDAYALIKVMKLNHGVDKFKILVNMAPDMVTAKDIFKKLYMACDHFLSGVSLELTGVIPRDPKMREAVINQTPLCKLSPSSPACIKIGEAAKKITTWKSTSELDGNIKFFWKKLLFQEQSVA
ncbi:MinD/ParA family protein [Maridesulfovibrio ferrireducens]|uniref:Flagellar biosynthesis protein FlhG n=1 Tax=Maridesulfovibrio ferrireducens TaxID=246191 RepID=A0A1G9EIP2_9BACT|nr:MinD/ParA family protein [Maridesulfovibrio ferrireducens]MBI9111529.1 MinD/ParA family protein [Maridesulfovibrio ferrireducens]SDK75958.1 flagellar biosynthesis protein FlhG [Maridesulfovibrio ferrireducens]